VNFNLFHIDRSPPKTPEEFSRAVRFHSSITEDYTCEKCPCWNCGGKVAEKRDKGAATWQCVSCEAVQKKCTAVRLYKLALIPEIVFCMFNAYRNKVARYFPEEFRISSADGGFMIYKLVGQIEHAGSLGGGHYWARGLRSGGVFMLNDTGVSSCRFENTANTYIVAYNYAGSVSAADASAADATVPSTSISSLATAMPSVA
jgi:ubiquitin C-terminal hydrolase